MTADSALGLRSSGQAAPAAYGWRRAHHPGATVYQCATSFDRLSLKTLATADSADVLTDHGRFARRGRRSIRTERGAR